MLSPDPTNSPRTYTDELIYSERNRYSLLEGERLLVEQVLDPGTANLASSFEYYTDSFKKVTTFNNSATNAADSECRVLEINYSTNNPVITQVEKVLDHVVARRFRAVYANTNVQDIVCQDPNAAWNDTNNLVTITKTYDNNHAFKFRLASIKHPDGTVAFYTYSTNATELTTTISEGQPSAVQTNIVEEGTQTVTVVGVLGEMKSRTVYPIIASNPDTNKILAREIYTYLGDDAFKLTPTITNLDGTTTSGTQCSCGAAGPESTTDKDGTTTYYTYDALRRLNSSKTLGITTTNLLDAMGRSLATVRVGTNSIPMTLRKTTFDVAGRVRWQVSALNGTNTFTEGVDGSGYFVRTNTYPDGATRIETYLREKELKEIGGTAVHPVRYEYGVEYAGTNSSGVSLTNYFVKEIRLTSSGGTSEWTKTYYDVVGRPWKTVYAGASAPTRKNFYNYKGQLIKQIDPDGVTTLYQYNGKGELEYNVLDVNRNGFIDFSGTNATDRITRTVSAVITNGPLGTNVVRTQTSVWNQDNVDASIPLATVERSLEGLQTWTTISNGAAAVVIRGQTGYAGNGNRYFTNTALDGSYVVNAFSYGRLSSVTRYSAAGSQLGQTTYGYDEHGRVKSLTDARNGTTTYRYNNADQVISVTTPAPGTGQAAQTTTTEFDNEGRPNKVVLADGTSVTNEYHLTGALKRTYGSRSYPVGYGYDAQGRLTIMTNWTTFSGAGERTNIWTYDQYRGWLTSKHYPDGWGPSYFYYPSGRLEERVWARGFSTVYYYNNAGDLSSVDYGDTTPDLSYTYDRRGRVKTIIQGSSTNTFYYNDASQLMGEIYTNGTLSGLTITNLYNSYLQRTQNAAKKTDGTVLSTASFAYDNASRLTNVTDGIYSAGYTYLANSPLIGQITFQQSGSTKMTSTKQYDYLNRILSISSGPVSAGIVPLSFDNAYNDANQRTRVTLNDGSFWVYEYDKLGQVASGKRYWSDGTPVVGQQFEYGFDEIGNRTSTQIGGNQYGTGLRSATYLGNSLNQTTNRTVSDKVDILGIANSSAAVTVNSSSADYRRGEYFQELVTVNNGSAAAWPGVTNIADLSGTKATNSGNVFVPKTGVDR